jgi:hypothetical protein
MYFTSKERSFRIALTVPFRNLTTGLDQRNIKLRQTTCITLSAGYNNETMGEIAIIWPAS